MHQETSIEFLESFLNIPIDDGSEIFGRFAVLPGAQVHWGKKPLERFVFIPGTREDRVVLVAHADTVWDMAYGNPNRTTAVYQDGVFRSTNPQCGIGADDRAGCAMLWALRHTGHSLLVVDGEERGKVGANYLRRRHRKLFRQLNAHRYMMELDWQGTGGCLFNQVPDTEIFKQYITQTLGFRDDRKRGGSDLQALCRKICGVNVGIGYQDFHRPEETLDVAQWENTYRQLEKFLQRPQPKFAIPRSKQFRAFLSRGKWKLLALVRNGRKRLQKGNAQLQKAEAKDTERK